MNFYYGLFQSYFKHYQGKENNLEMNSELSLSLVKGERFAFQLLIKSSEEFTCRIGKYNDISWKGLIENVRLSVEKNHKLDNDIQLSFLGYVKDDEGNIVSDPILREKTKIIKKDEYQSIWVEGKIPQNFCDEELQLKIKVYYSKGYNKEEIISTIDVNLKVKNFVLLNPREGAFHLDLWQHLSNWARAYNVEYFSEEHWSIIRNYMKELASMGQKVVTVVASDYSWAGQGCYNEFENPSNLFEMNIINVLKDKNGKVKCDFTNVDKYIDICFELGIDREIDIFGIVGNWDGKVFGNPMKDYKDPIRISYFSQKEQTYSYFDSKAELGEYLRLVFKHFKDMGWLDKVRIMSDEPNNIKLFKECVDFICSCTDGEKVKFKSAIHHQEFYESFSSNIQDISLNTCELISNISQIEKIAHEISNKGGTVTWYSCCFPQKLNTFIKSPLIESRLTPWFTYYVGFHGFLRWAYAIWPEKPYDQISYKHPWWTAGDMFFVYPGKDMKPVRSIRWENLRFGIQDYNLFKQIEQLGIDRQNIAEKIEVLLGKKEKMKYIGERQVQMSYSVDGNDYLNMRQQMLTEWRV